MGYVKEPDGIDFVIKSKPLTDKQKRELSAFIKADKERLATLANRKAKARSAKIRLEQ
jgi:hypothetical protein